MKESFLFFFFYIDYESRFVLNSCQGAFGNFGPKKMLTQPFQHAATFPEVLTRVGGSRKKQKKCLLKNLFGFPVFALWSSNQASFSFFSSRVPDLSPPVALNGFFQGPSELTREALLLALL